MKILIAILFLPLIIISFPIAFFRVVYWFVNDLSKKWAEKIILKLNDKL